MGDAFSTQGYKISNRPQDIRNLVINQFEEVQLKVKNIIKTIRDKQLSFSLTLNKYTFSKNIRFLNLNLHGQENVINL